MAKVRLRGALGAIGALWLAVGCADGESSIRLVFPNEVARSVIRRLRVEAYNPDAGGTGVSARTCLDFLGEARTGNDPLGAPVRGDYQCPELCADGWFTEQELAQVPSGRQIIYALAYASTDAEAVPILEGCTDGFDSTDDRGDSENVEVVLDFVIPDGARLVKVDGDRQVGRAQSTLGLPLAVEVRADEPILGGPYVIPGVPVEFTSETQEFEVAGGTSLVVPAGADGRAKAAVRLPATAGSGVIAARAQPLNSVPNAVPVVRFSVSVTEPTEFAQVDVVPAGTGGQPVALALGDLDGAGSSDLAVLRCDGTAAACTPAANMSSVGAGRLSVIRDVGDPQARRVLSAGATVGVLPADLAVVDMALPAGRSEIAVLNARRADCQDRVCPEEGACECFRSAPGLPCPCEGSEIRLFEVGADAANLLGAYTLTASNAVAMAVVPDPELGTFDSLVVAGQGRLRNERPCNRSNSCRQPNPSISEERALCENDPLLCGCPPNEFCECTDCSSDNLVGFCRADDKMLDFLTVRSGALGDLYNRGGCQRVSAQCGGDPDVSSTRINTCECLDAAERGGSCVGSEDACGCRVPRAVRLGQTSAPVFPLGLTAGALRPGSSPDLVVPNVDGLGFATANRGDPPFTFEEIPVVNAPVHRAVVTALDAAAERDLGITDAAPDVVWTARARCTEGFEGACPTTDVNGDSDPKTGCLGVYFTDGADSVLRLAPPGNGGCRRHALSYVPDGLCAGRFNADEHVDIAVSARGVPDVLIYSGDGRGGLLDPPERIPLPAEGGGPLVCGDLDGDARTDIAVFSTDARGEMTGVVLLKTRP